MKPELLGALPTIALLALAACAAPDAPPAAAPTTEAVLDRSFYVCPDDVVFSVDFLADAARVYLIDRVVRLPRDGADGRRYHDGAMELRVEDGAARLSDRDDGIRCLAEGSGEVWREAVRRGVVFRAMGQEPGWLAEVDGEGRMVVVLDYGTERIEARVPARARTDRGEEYRTQTADHAIRLVIEDRPCRDTMSGESFPASVRLDVDGRSYEGCGIRLS
jgi:hypothetical protein